MTTIATVRISEPIVLDENSIEVPFFVEPDRTAGVTHVSTDGSRVRVVTLLNDYRHPVLSHKLDPNEPENDYAVVRAEIMRIQPFTLPATTTDVEQIASVVHSYVINARPEWS